MDGKDLQIMNDEQRTMVLQNYNLIHHVLKQFNIQKDKYDDFEQIGALALCKAAISYDSSKGFKFTTYAVSCIRFTILTYFRTYEMGIIKLPINVYKATLKGKKELLRYDSYEGILESDKTNWEPHVDYDKPGTNVEEQVLDDIYIQNILSTLTEEESEILDYLLEGYSQAEISRIYNCSRANINIKIQGIRKKLRTLFDDENEGEIDLSDESIYEKM